MLNELAKDLWVAWTPQSFYGLRFGARMTVVRLDDGSLFVLVGDIDMTPPADPGKRFYPPAAPRKKGIVVLDAA